MVIRHWGNYRARNTWDRWLVATSHDERNKLRLELGRAVQTEREAQRQALRLVALHAATLLDAGALAQLDPSTARGYAKLLACRSAREAKAARRAQRQQG